MAAASLTLALFTSGTGQAEPEPKRPFPRSNQATELVLGFAIATPSLHSSTGANKINLETGLLPSTSPSSRSRAMALPRYPNHNTPYDPWEDPELNMPPEKMLKKGDPGTFQAVIKGAMPVGYWVTMPNGNEAYLPAQDIGFLGGLERLRKIFKPGDEVTVRVVTRGSSGREVLSLKIPDPNKPDPPPKPLRKDFLPGGSLAARRRRYQQQQ